MNSLTCGKKVGALTVELPFDFNNKLKMKMLVQFLHQHFFSFYNSLPELCVPFFMCICFQLINSSQFFMRYKENMPHLRAMNVLKWSLLPTYELFHIGEREEDIHFINLRSNSTTTNWFYYKSPFGLYVG